MPFVDLKKGVHLNQTIQSTRPEVIIHGKSHVIRLNRVCYEMLGEPKRVRVAWDSEERLLGIKAARSDDPASFAITITKNGGYIISSASVIRMIGIGTASTGYLLAEMKDEYLAVSPYKKQEGIFAEVFAEDNHAENLL